MKRKLALILVISFFVGLSYLASVSSISFSRLKINKTAASKPIIYEKKTSRSEGALYNKDFSLSGLVPSFAISKNR